MGERGVKGVSRGREIMLIHPDVTSLVSVTTIYINIERVSF